MISRQFSRTTLVGAVRSRQILHVSSILGRTPARGFGGCAKLNHQLKEFEKPLLYNSEKVANAFKGCGQITQIATLLASTAHTPNPRRYRHTLALYEEMILLLAETRKVTQSSLELANVLVDCLEGISNLMHSPAQEVPDGEQGIIFEQIKHKELEFLEICMQYLLKAYVLLNIEEKVLLKASLKRLVELEGRLPDRVRVQLSQISEHIASTDLMTSVAYRDLFFKELGLANHLKTESINFSFEMNNSLARSAPQSRLTVRELTTDKTLDFFCLSDADILGQTLKLGKFFEDAPKLQSLVLDSSPVINPASFAKKDKNVEKMYEYSQYLVKDWPYFYKFVGG